MSIIIATKQHSVDESGFIRRTRLEPAHIHLAQDAPPDLSPLPLIAQLALSFLAIMILNFISYCDKCHESWSVARLRFNDNEYCAIMGYELISCARARGLPRAPHAHVHRITGMRH